ncbi:hypothetical protein BDV93DRAFT_529196 [Ceratobasidium sp. AG-I]|nr:hypothetical protein BDV93DRAFT_529196 [Ceratobasidium sp. AG-I]
MPCPSLPTECYLEIISYVSSATTLGRLLQVSQGFRAIALPLLYESVSLIREDSVRQFCKNVQNDSSLGLLVKSFSIASTATPQDESSSHTDFLAGINSALMNMVSLTDLSIRLVEQPPYQRRHWIFTGTTFQLRRLELRMDYDSALIDFLARQPELESLTLLGAVPDHLTSMRLELPLNALPKLAHFHGHYTQALALVPHRPVREVHITQVDDSGEFEPSDVFVCLKDTVETLAHSTGPLEEIAFDDEDADYGLLEVVLCNMPTLRSINLFVPEHGHSWRRYINPQWPSYMKSRIPDQPIRLERLNASQDAFSAPPTPTGTLSHLLTIPHHSTPQSAFHASLYTPFFPSDPTNPSLGPAGSTGQAMVANRWRQAFPALGYVQFTDEPGWAYMQGPGATGMWAPV